MVEAELTDVDGRRLTFTVHAFDDAATVCRGGHRRAVIDTERFWPGWVNGGPADTGQFGTGVSRCRR